MEQLSKSFQKDIQNIGQIPLVTQLLDVVCQTTGMGFAAIARVTQDSWIACQVKDTISFGMKPGDELQIKTTICNEIRQSGIPVIINHVAEDKDFREHHTPAMYGFQSYISIPIFRKDKTFFGTLCAIDPHPRDLKRPEIIDIFNLFADLISFHLEAAEKLDSTLLDLKAQHNFNNELEEKIKQRTAELEEKNEMLLKSNKELQEFNYVSSHDLQEPLRKIQTFISRIQAETGILSGAGAIYLERISESAHRMRLLINDLLSYSQTDEVRRKFEVIDLNQILTEVLHDFKEEISQHSATIEIGTMCNVSAIPFQITQLFYNIIGNSLKYASPKRQLIIEINSEIIQADEIIDYTPEYENYCHVRIKDNGIGFDPIYSEKIFGLFQRLHAKSEYTGTGVGLAIVKKIMENHKGKIKATGIKGGGSEFNIYIPVT